MKYNLFLDDERHPTDVSWVKLPLVNWYIAKNYKQFLDIIKREGLPSIVSFDHDLCDEHYEDAKSKIIPYCSYTEKTGYDAAKWLINYCIDNKLELPEYYIHTMNVVGKENIESLFNSYRKINES